VLAGVENLAVIVEGGVVLVARRDAPGAVRAAVEAVRKAGREDLLWGLFESAGPTLSRLVR